MALSVVAIKAARSRDKAYKLSDSDGLYLLVTPAGGRYWRMNYRHLGKQKTLAFGVWPETGRAEARAERDAARKVLARGDDPAERIKLDRIAAAVATSKARSSRRDHDAPRGWRAAALARSVQGQRKRPRGSAAAAPRIRAPRRAAGSMG